MIKVTYYVGTNDKNTLKPELWKSDFIKIFDEVFKDYTLQKAQNRVANKNNQVILENIFIITVFNDESRFKNYQSTVKENCRILKETLNVKLIQYEIECPLTHFI